MSFYDVNYINYANLERTSRFQKPYQDSGNAYPLGDRRYSARHFRKEDDGSFSLWYVNRKTSDEMQTGTLPVGKEQNRHWYAKRKLGVVRPDNSFEFLNSSGQGENMLLCEGLRGDLHHCSRKGGLVFNRGPYIHPVFEGLRIDCDSGEALTDYKLFQAVVNRKKSNEYMKQFSEFKTVAPVMLNSMDDNGIIQVYDDLYEIHKDLFMKLDDRHVIELAREGKYVDALCLLCMVMNLAWELKHGAKTRYEARQSGEPIPHYLNRLPARFKERALHILKAKFRDLAVGQQEDLFELEELRAGKELPDSKWRLKVTVNNMTANRL